MSLPAFETEDVLQRPNVSQVGDFDADLLFDLSFYGLVSIFAELDLPAERRVEGFAFRLVEAFSHKDGFAFPENADALNSNVSSQFFCVPFWKTVSRFPSPDLDSWSVGGRLSI